MDRDNTIEELEPPSAFYATTEEKIENTIKERNKDLTLYDNFHSLELWLEDRQKRSVIGTRAFSTSPRAWWIFLRNGELFTHMCILLYTFDKF